MTLVRQAVIMVGGLGTRLRPLTLTRPKPMLPVLGRPCVEYLVRALGDAGVEEVVLACGYRSEQLVRHFDSIDIGVDVTFAFEDEPAGTAGSVKLLEDRLDGTTIVGSGDVLADVDVVDLVSSHRTNGAYATMALTEVDDPTAFGIVGLDDDDRIVRFKEKPREEEVFSNLINAGLYVLERDVLSHVPEGVMYDFSKQLYPDLLSRGFGLYGHRIKGMWKDIGKPRDLLEANVLMARRHPSAPDGAECVGGVHVTDSIVPKGSRLEDAVVGMGSQLMRSVSMTYSMAMDGCVIGDGTTLEGTILGEGCVIGENCRLIGCVVADGAVVPDGTELRDVKIGADGNQ